MSDYAVFFFSIFSGLCSIVALCLFFVSVPSAQRTISLLVTSFLIGVPISLLLIKENALIFAINIVLSSGSSVAFSYLYGKSKTLTKTPLADILHISNKRTSGLEWMHECVSKINSGTVNIDAFGVKLDALYKLIKGATYKSKLPEHLVINMRALFLEPGSHGVRSRAVIENNDKVLSDVELMKGVWIKTVKEYRRHPQHSLKVKSFEFTPSFYILRVNDKMLIGMYLAESGYENLSMHLERSDGATFCQFERYFERIWSTCSKSVCGAVKAQ